MNSKNYFIKNIYKLHDDEGNVEAVVKIYQVTKEEGDKDIHNIIQIKTKSGSIQLLTEDHDKHQSCVKKISDNDFKNCLELGDSYYHRVIWDSTEEE
jgi:hypothetical protein